jgi:hypothetical protein
MRSLWMKALGLVVVACGALPVHGAGQSAVVTFYSHGSRLKSGVPGTNDGIFYGCIYDGNERLGCFRDGFFVRNNRFAVFDLAPGVHTFSASYGKHPAKNSQTTVLLEKGKHYFFRAQSESRGVIEIEWERGRLDEIDCNVARDELGNATALKTKVLARNSPGLVDPTQSVPACP